MAIVIFYVLNTLLPSARILVDVINHLPECQPIPSSRLQVVLVRQQGTAFSLKYRTQGPPGDWILAALEIEGLN